MKVDYVSDLHINHYVHWNENQIKFEKRTREWARDLLKSKSGEVLILAGDFGEINVQAFWFVDEISKAYDKVFVTFGNHDLYLTSKNQIKKYGDSIGRLYDLSDRLNAINNVTALPEGGYEEYKGVKFAGSPLWYLPRRQESWEFFENVSNDSNYIKVDGHTKRDMIRVLWKSTMDWYEDLGEVDILFTHVPPVHSPFLKYDPNECYYSPVTELKAKHWICGHDHSKGVFNKAGTAFYVNCLGYPHEQREVKLESFDVLV